MYTRLKTFDLCQNYPGQIKQEWRVKLKHHKPRSELLKTGGTSVPYKRYSLRPKCGLLGTITQMYKPLKTFDLCQHYLGQVKQEWRVKVKHHKPRSELLKTGGTGFPYKRYNQSVSYLGLITRVCKPLKTFDLC